MLRVFTCTWLRRRTCATTTLFLIFVITFQKYQKILGLKPRRLRRNDTQMKILTLR